MTVTAIICTYQRPQFLHESLNSVLTQTRPADEVIVVFDGGDVEVFEHFCQMYPAVRFIFQENQGRSIAANRGVYESTSELVAFLDDDDIWYPNKLQFILLEMERNNSKAANHFYDTIDTDGKVAAINCDHMLKRNEDLPCLLLRNPCAYSTTVVSRELFLLSGGMAPFQNIADDWTFYMNITRLESWHTISAELGAYRIHSSQISSNYESGLRILAQIFAYYYGGRPARTCKSDVAMTVADSEVTTLASTVCWSALKVLDFRRLCQTIGLYIAFSGSFWSLFKLCFYLPPVNRIFHWFWRGRHS